MRTAVIIALTVGFIAVLAFSAILILFGHSEEFDKLVALVAPGIGLLVNIYLVNRVRKVTEEDLKQTKETREIIVNGQNSSSTTGQ